MRSSKAVGMMALAAGASLAFTAGASASIMFGGTTSFPTADSGSTNGSTFTLVNGGVTATFTIDTADGNDTNDVADDFIISTQDPSGSLGAKGGAGGPRVGNNESFTITFDQDVVLKSVLVGGTSMTFSNGDTINLDASAGSDQFFPANTTLLAGDELWVTTSGPAGFWNITIVPEPASLALLGLGGLMLLPRRRA